MKEAMHILDAQAAAGSGDFSRVLFERSGTKTHTAANSYAKFFITAKFAAAEDGLHKISFGYSAYSTAASSQSNLVRIYLRGGVSVPTYSTGGGVTSSLNHKIDVAWYFDAIIGDYERDTMPKHGKADILLAAIPDISTTPIEANIVSYVYMRKGEPFIITGEYINSLYPTSYFSIKNLKVTY